MGHRLLSAVAIGLIVGGHAATARADETGFEIGGRLGYGVPLGHVADEDDSELSDFASGMIPFWIDIGGRVVPELMVGGYLQLGVGFPGDVFDEACDDDDVDCSVTDVRIGAQLQYHPLPFQSTDPWFGVGVGYEWWSIHADSPAGDASISVHGFEFVNLQGGVDFKVAESGGIGPFLSLSLGQFDTATIDGGTEEVSDDIEEKALHEWLVIGVRGTFVL